MDHATLSTLRDRHPAWRLLASPHAPLVAILDQLRGYFPQAASFLMDRETLLAHRLHWGDEPDPARHDLSRLTTQEAEVFDELRFDRLQPKLRLEQERVGYGWLGDRLSRIAADSGPCYPHQW